MASGAEKRVLFDGSLLVAQCRDMLLFDTPEVLLLKDGTHPCCSTRPPPLTHASQLPYRTALCDPTRIERPSKAGSGLQYLIPDKSVGRLVFADRDCANPDARFQEVQVVCEVSYSDAIDTITEEPLEGTQSVRGRSLVVFGTWGAGMRGWGWV